MNKKIDVKKFIFCFTLLAIGGLIYNIVKDYIPLGNLSIKDKQLVGIFCFISYAIGGIAGIIFNKFMNQITQKS